MAKKKHIFLLVFASLLALASSVSLRAQSAVSASPAHNVIWAQKLYRQVEFLADTLCQGRGTGSRGIVEAGFYIASEYKRLGLLPLTNNGKDACQATSYAVHCTLPNGKFGHNMVAMMPGSLKSPKDSYVIVGAHYDHLGTIGGKCYPGADDNASGTVAMLSIAQMFSTMKLIGRAYNSNVIFVAFDAKELSMSGSKCFWESLQKGDLQDPLTGKAITPDKIKLMVNIDQIGGVSEPIHKGRKDYLIMLGNESLPRQYQGTAAYVKRLYCNTLDLHFDYYGSARFTEMFYRKLSDQKWFVEGRRPAVLFTSGITMMTNKPTDTAATLDYEILRLRIIYMFHFIEKML